MDAIPDLEGKICEALVKQEYWYKSAKQLDLHVLFLKIQDENWQRIFFDSETLFWSEVDFPDVWRTSTTDLFHYPQVDIGVDLGVVGQAIESVDLQKKDELVEIHFRFLCGLLLTLRHWFAQDVMYLEVSKQNF